MKGPRRQYGWVLFLFALYVSCADGQRFELRRVPESTGEAPVPRYGASMVSFKGGSEVVVFGGRTQKRVLGDTWIYETVSNRWTKVPGHGPSPRFDALGVGIDFGGNTGRQMYLLGGRNMKTVLNSSLMWVFDLASRKWSEVSVQTGVKGASVEHVLARAAAMGGPTELRNILISHGMSSTEMLSDAYLLTFETKTSAVVQYKVYGESRTFTVGDPRALSAAASALTPANELVIVGGCYQTGLCPNQDVWSLDLFHREWRYLSRGPSPRQFGSLAVALPSMASASMDTRQTVVLWGGAEQSSQITRVEEASPYEVDVLDVRNRKWQREKASEGTRGGLQKRFAANMVAIGNGSVTNKFRYFIFGGADDERVPVSGSLFLLFDPKKPQKLVSKHTARVQSYLYVHGIIMWIAYGLLLPAGALTARYLRSLTSTSKWFIIHGTFQTVGGLLAWIGLIFGMIGANDKPVHAHAVFGSIIMVLMSFQIVSGTPCVRPNPNSGMKRQVWSVLHHSVGWFIIAFGLFNCIVGMILLVLPCGTWISMLVAISVLLAISMGFEARRLSRRDHKTSRYIEEPFGELPKAGAHL